MKAIVCEKYGSPDVLQLKEVPVPSPGANEVRVKVHAVSLNDWDWGYISGKPALFRLMSGLTRPKKQILGSDVAGTIDAVGENVESFEVGQAVFGDLSTRWGGFAEYVCADPAALTSKPTSMSWLDAAAIPQAGCLAMQGLVDYGPIEPGMSVLINGAGGGVGTFGIQLARQHDVEVTGVDNSGKLAMMTELGFDHVIDYTAEDFTRNGKQYDLILDQKTTRPVRHYLRSLAPGGKYNTTGGHLGKLFRVFASGFLVKKTTGKTVQVVPLDLNKDLDKMVTLYESGQFQPFIGQVFKLEDVPEAFRVFAAGQHKGKLVVEVDDRP